MTDEVFGALKVVDCGSYVAGPAAATVLADLGADVVKVEPLDGDPLRRLTRVYPSYFWRLDARSKKGLAIDIKHPTGREALIRLVREADIFVTNYRASLLERLNLTYDVLAEINPRLIYAQITGYGLKGPDAERTAFDSTAWWGRSGLQDWVRGADNAPNMSSPGMGDHATSMALFGAIAAALYKREITGKGARVHTSLAANGAWSHSMGLQAASAGATWALRHPNRRPRAVHLNQLYETRDHRYVFMSVLNPAKEYVPLLRALRLEHLLTDDPQFADVTSAFEHMPEFVAHVEKAIAAADLTELRARLDAEGVTYGFAQQIEEVLADPQLWANDVLIDVAEPAEGYSATVASPIWIDGVDKVAPKLAPDVGEHNQEVLESIGFSSADIDKMRRDGVITSGHVTGIE